MDLSNEHGLRAGIFLLSDQPSRACQTMECLPIHIKASAPRYTGWPNKIIKKNKSIMSMSSSKELSAPFCVSSFAKGKGDPHFASLQKEGAEGQPFEGHTHSRAVASPSFGQLCRPVSSTNVFWEGPLSALLSFQLRTPRWFPLPTELLKLCIPGHHQKCTPRGDAASPKRVLHSSLTCRATAPSPELQVLRKVSPLLRVCVGLLSRQRYTTIDACIQLSALLAWSKGMTATCWRH